MPFKKITILVLLIIFIIPISVRAENVTLLEKQERLQLLLKIQELLKIVAELEFRLSEINSTKAKNEVVKEVETKTFTSNDREPYQSIYFDFPHEFIYFVENGILVNSNKTSLVRRSDQALFDLFKSIVGKDEVQKHLVEWRIFYNEDGGVGAYVESTNGLQDWILGVNRAGYREGSRAVTHAYTNLFIHEYAHILFAESEILNKSFADRFWTAADKRHQQQIKTADSDYRFILTNNYYNQNKNRFVSDYATINPDEDMAETFIYFIREDKPVGNTVRDQKILFFYQEPSLVKVRTNIKNNLSRL